MGALQRFPFSLVFAVLLVGCTSDTHSIVSADDVPATRYRQIAVFVENLQGADSIEAERLLISALRTAGVRAGGKSEIFQNQANMDSDAQGEFIRTQGFDSVLYVTVLENGYVPEGVNTAVLNTPAIHFNFSAPRPAEWALKTKAELQDANTGKIVWSAETVAKGNADLSNMNLVFTQAARQIIEKLRTDHVI